MKHADIISKLFIGSAISDEEEEMKSPYSLPEPVKGKHQPDLWPLCRKSTTQ